MRYRERERERETERETEGGMGRSEVDTFESPIGNGADQICKEDEGFFACYLLTSLSPRHKGYTYIGFTINPRRRLRQHNGEIPSGAWKTKSKRPWEMVLCVFGFPTNVAALQFEWAWQHPTESLAVRSVAAGFRSFTGVSNKIKLAYTMLTLPSWEGLNLTVNFFSTKYTKHCAGCPKLPEHMKFHVCPVDDLPCYIGSKNYWGSADDDYGDCEELQSPNTAENALGEQSQGSIALRDFGGCGGSGSPEREVSSFCFNATVEDGEEEIRTSESDRFELGCWSRTDIQKTLDKLNECGEAEAVDLSTPYPNSRIDSCNAKKRKVSMTHPQIIDLTGCPKLPEHMKFHVCPVDDLPCYIGGQNYWVSADDDYGDCEELQSPNAAENALGEHSGETADGSIALRDVEGCCGSGSPKREVSSFCFNVTVEDGEEEILTSEPDTFESGCWSRTSIQKTLDKLNECDDAEVVDLSTPYPNSRTDSCNAKKRKVSTTHPQIIDLTRSPIFVEL